MAEAAPYRIEPAKSGRAVCVASKEIIAKDELRFGSLVMMGGSSGSYKWRKISHVTAKVLAGVDEKVGNFENVDGFAELSAEQKMEVTKVFKTAKESATSGKAAAKKAAAKPKGKAKAKAKGKAGAKAAEGDDCADGGEGDALGASSDVTPPGKKRKISEEDSALAEVDITKLAHELISLARDANWELLFERLDRHKEVVNVRPAVRDMSILHQAAYHGQLDIIQKLLEVYGADPTLRSKGGKTPMEIAEDQGYLDAEKLLSSHVPEGGGIGQIVISPPTELLGDVESVAHSLIDLARDGKWDELFAKLDNHRSLVNARPAVRAYGILHQAAYHGDDRALALLLDNYGADPAAVNKHGQTPADVAAERGHALAAEMLGSRCAFANGRTLTPEKPAKLPAGDALGFKAAGATSPEPAAAEAAGADDLEMVQMPDGTWKVMAKVAADNGGSSSSSSCPPAAAPPAATSDEKTSFSSGSSMASEEVAHKLIDYARDAQWDSLFELLSRHPTLVNVRPKVRNYSILHQAAYNGSLESTKRLVEEFGADAASLSKSEQTAADVALECDNSGIVDYLHKVQGIASDTPDDFDMVQQPDGSWQISAKGGA
mmetsp:Transcript_75593/g.179636  ORF Transcript_75593/g.179636 Transcript_75593/m.179636 type:complete len:603 (+) Transcript_75593:66-1874(+)|eukprot:CAMPEP_0178409018 /NCGR_PEP_ID=MMETSP0689_2-20121128/20243_1 /TAXON_ID=160604 /ORGANISM="Amphidinium massartii, Strain CS-259" /LENGTH=602 /DNA_ID=CAMNT_0020030141 /DNA_START=141 /DNA_END=1949 /DNA_ORIENTATION=+